MARPWNSKDPLGANWTNRAHQQYVDGTTSAHAMATSVLLSANIDGPCPSCDHRLVQDIVLALVASASPTYQSRKSLADFVDVDFTCDCGEEHPGRPDDAPIGCGTSFRLRLPIESS